MAIFDGSWYVDSIKWHAAKAEYYLALAVQDEAEGFPAAAEHCLVCAMEHEGHAAYYREQLTYLSA